MKKSVYIKTFGCQMNKADSKRLEESFAARGYTPAKLPEEADVIVYNTCSVREHAENRAMSHIGRLKFIKKKNPSLRVCVVGCMAQRMGEEIRKRLPHVDVVAGPVSMGRLPEFLEDEDSSGVLSDNISEKQYSEYLPDIILSEKEYARFVPIMRGCENFCAYCIVPHVRGREKYRKKEDVLSECRALAGKGVKEVTLLGQAVNSHPEFKEILKGAASVEGIERVRFLTSYPGYMDKETIDIVRESDVLCNMFHLPLQSGSDAVLKAMNRKYTAAHYLQIASYIREILPVPASISTDLIVGFPGEREEDFEKTLQAVSRVEFDQSYTFKYSPRPGTAAAGIKETVSGDEKQRRLERLNELCDEVSLKRNKLLVGREVAVFSDGQNSGRTPENKIVHFKGQPAGAGRQVSVKITRALPHSLKGKRVD